MLSVTGQFSQLGSQAEGLSFSQCKGSHSSGQLQGRPRYHRASWGSGYILKEHSRYSAPEDWDTHTRGGGQTDRQTESDIGGKEKWV